MAQGMGLKLLFISCFFFFFLVPNLWQHTLSDFSFTDRDSQLANNAKPPGCWGLPSPTGGSLQLCSRGWAGVSTAGLHCQMGASRGPDGQVWCAGWKGAQGGLSTALLKTAIGPGSEADYSIPTLLERDLEGILEKTKMKRETESSVLKKKALPWHLRTGLR